MIDWLRHRKSWLLGAVVLVLAASAVLVEPWVRAAGGDVVAEVNGQPITRDAFYQALEAAVGAQVLDQLITEAVVLQAGAELPEPVTDEVVAEALASLRSAYPSEAIYQATLAAYGLDEAQLAHQLRLSLILERLATRDVVVTDDEVAAYFEEHAEALAHPERVRARHILVETEEEAEAIIERLEKGEPFEELAAQHSLDQATRATGGDVGFFSQADNLVDAFKEAAFALEVGEVSPPVKSPYGYHVIQVTEREEARPATLEEEAPGIRERLVREKATPVSEVLNQLLEQAEVVIHWDRYRALQPAGEAAGAEQPAQDEAQEAAAQDSGGAPADRRPESQAKQGED